MRKFAKRAKTFGFALLYIIIYVIAETAVQGIYIFVSKTNSNQTAAEISRSLINGTYALGIIGMIISMWIYMLIGRLRNESMIKKVGTHRITPVISFMTVCAAVGSRLVVTVYYNLANNVALLKKSIDDAAEIAPDIENGYQELIVLFAVLFAAPFFEELLFRVLVMGELRKIMRPWAAITLQALLFGIAHAVLFQSLFAFVIGIFLGIIYFKTGSIRASAACHGVFNATAAVSVLEFGKKGLLAALAAGIVLIVMSMIYICNSSGE